MKTDFTCQSCNTKNILFIKKEQSKKEVKIETTMGFHVCKKCDPAMASFAYLENGYEELRKILYSQNSKKG